MEDAPSLRMPALPKSTCEGMDAFSNTELKWKSLTGFKCDGMRPSCGQCVALNSHCPGYFKALRFIDDGEKVVRKRQKRAQATRVTPSERSGQAGRSTRNRSGGAQSLAVMPVPGPLREEAPATSTGSTTLNIAVVTANHQPTHSVQGHELSFEPSAIAPVGFDDGPDVEIGAVMSDFMLQSEQEMVFLLRHYVDNIASW